MHRKLYVICIFFGINNIFAYSTYQNSISTKKISNQALDLIIKDSIKKFNVPGAAIGVIYEDQIILLQGYGTREINKKLPVTEYTLFPIGSCSKAFTALLLSQLVDEGIISFDDPVIKFIPEISFLNQELRLKLTIRDLLSHRTGIAYHDPIWVYHDFPRTNVIPLLSHLDSSSELGKKFTYSNFMYVLAGIIIERVMGESWEDAMLSRILKPLRMDHSNLSIECMKATLDFSSPHAEINGTHACIPFRDQKHMCPAGGINSNIVDMLEWIKLQLTNTSLLQVCNLQLETLQETHLVQVSLPSTPNISEELSELGYGLGWFIGKYRGYDFIYHGGDIDGFSSNVSLLPSENLGLVILTNSSTDGRFFISSVRNQILDKILQKETTDWVEKIQAIRNKIKQSIQTALKQFDDIKILNHSIKDNCLDNYVGFYEHSAYGVIEITIKKNQLFASYGKMQLPLYYKSKNTFTCQSPILLYYGIEPNMDFVFFKNADQVCHEVEVPFENFRFAKPIKFVRAE